MKKNFIMLFLSLFLVSCFGNKEEIKKTTGTGVVVGKNEIEKVEEKDFKELSLRDISNELYSLNGNLNLKEKIEYLKNDSNFENKQKATYLMSFLGDYENAIKDRKELCDKEKNLNYCENVDLKINSFIPEDNLGNTLSGVKVRLDNREIKGQKDLKIEKNFVHRISYSKEGYLDYYFKINVLQNKEDVNIAPVLLKANLEKEFTSSEGMEEKTNNFKFSIEENSFLNMDGTPYNGKVKAYFFDLGENENNENVFNLDAFDENGSFVGNSMVTFGMPYINFFDEKGNEIKTKEGFYGKGFIQNKHRAPGIDLINVPKNIYLGREELLKYNIPPFWILTEKGVWKEAKMKILDEKGNYEFIYDKYI